MKEGDCVAVWGAGPIGLFATKWALDFFKAAKVVLIDNVPSRLLFAKQKVCDDERLVTLNFDEHDVLKSLTSLFPESVDVCIDAAGFRYTKTLLEKLQKALHLETDQSQVLTECIMACKKV